MANKSGYWKLIIDDDIELNNEDWDHIAEMIRQEYTEGEICETVEEDMEEY